MNRPEYHSAPSPPRFLLHFFKWFCRSDLHRYIEGDLLEFYEERVEEIGKRKADWRFALDVLLLFRPGIIRPFKLYRSSNHRAMLRHNLLLTFRNFRRYKSSFFINLIGLSSGLTCALLIFLWVHDELNVDKFHEKDHRLFQIMQNIPTPQGINTSENTQGLLAQTLVEEIPEIEYAVPVINFVSQRRTGVISADNNNVRASIQFVGKDFFNVFSYRLVYGNKNLALSNKHSVVVSDELALKLFNTTKNVIGKTVKCDYNHFDGIYQISGVFEKPPENSTNQFDFLFSYELIFEKYKSNLQNWENSNPHTYLILKEKTDINQFSRKIKHFIRPKLKNSEHTLFIRKYSDKYLYDNYENGVQAGGRIDYVKLFSIVTLLILLIACINFMNLSTAKASRRIKEIGVKKALGAQRKTLFLQHMTESMLMAFLSLAIALVFVFLLLPQFNEITGKHILLSIDTNLFFNTILITVFTGFVTGSYPSIFLSSFNPITILKGKISTDVGGLNVRKGLVIFQFVVSVMLIVSVLILYKQMSFVQSKNLGYNRNNIIQFERKEIPKERLETLLSEIKKISGVLNVSTIAGDVTRNKSMGVFSDVDWPGKNPDLKTQFWDLIVDYDFIETLNIELIAGRSFSKEFGTENSAIICNETAIKTMGIEDPIGKTITMMGAELQIIGVVKDFHFQSIHENIKPLVIRRYPNLSEVIIKIQAGTERRTIEQLANLYEEFAGFSFDYKFMSEEYAKLYAAEQRISDLSQYFAGIAIIISCLGLYGLAAFNVERKLKEIGIRKVLGASPVSIVQSLSSDFTMIVLLAILIALPISYLIAVSWMESFAYHIDIEWWYFAGAGLLALLIAWITVGLQTVKVATVNPVETLKSE